MTDRLSVRPVQISDADGWRLHFGTLIEKCGYPQKFHGNN